MIECLAADCDLCIVTHRLVGSRTNRIDVVQVLKTLADISQLHSYSDQLTVHFASHSQKHFYLKFKVTAVNSNLKIVLTGSDPIIRTGVL